MSKKSIVVASREPFQTLALATYGPLVMLGPGEPWFGPHAIPKHPETLWQAIRAMKQRQSVSWRAMARDVFGLARKRDAELLMPEGVLFKCAETNVVEPGYPLRVWIDAEGTYAVLVYFRKGTRR